MDARSAPRPRVREHRAERRSRARSLRQVRCVAHVHRWRLRRRCDVQSTVPGARRQCVPRALPGHPSAIVRACHAAALPQRRGAAGPGHRREAFRPRPDHRARIEPCDSRHLRRKLRLPHRSLSRKECGPEPPLLPLRQHVRGADLEPAVRRGRANHDGGRLRRRWSRIVLRQYRRHSRRRPEPPPAAAHQRRDRAAARSRPGARQRRTRQGPERNRNAPARGRRPRTVSRLSQRARGQSDVVRGDIRRFEALDQLVAMEGCAVLYPGREVHGDHVDGGGRQAASGAGGVHTGTAARELLPLSGYADADNRDHIVRQAARRCVTR